MIFHDGLGSTCIRILGHVPYIKTSVTDDDDDVVYFYHGQWVLVMNGDGQK